MKRVTRIKSANYVVVWDSSYEDPDSGKLTRAATRHLRGLGPELTTVRHSGHVVLRIFRQR